MDSLLLFQKLLEVVGKEHEDDLVRDLGGQLIYIPSSVGRRCTKKRNEEIYKYYLENKDKMSRDEIFLNMSRRYNKVSNTIRRVVQNCENVKK